MNDKLQSEIEAELDTFWECAYEIEKAYSYDESTLQQYLQEKQEAFGASLEKLTTLMISWAEKIIGEDEIVTGTERANGALSVDLTASYNNRLRAKQRQTLQNIRGGDE